MDGPSDIYTMLKADRQTHSALPTTFGLKHSLPITVVVVSDSSEASTRDTSEKPKLGNIERQVSHDPFSKARLIGGLKASFEFVQVTATVHVR